MNRFNTLDNELIVLKEKYNKINKNTQDDIQSIFDEIDLSDTKPINYTKREKLQRYIYKCKEYGIYNVYVLYLITKILSRKNIYQQDILEIKLLLTYDRQYKQYDESNQNTFKNILNNGYANCLNDIKEKANMPNMWLLLPLALKKVNAGYIYQEYINTRIKYDAEQIKKQALISNQQQKELNIDNYEFKKIVDLQNKQTLNVTQKEDKLKFSGFVELMSTSLYHTGYLKACDDYDIEKVQFISVMDSVTTNVCKSMNMQVFYINKMNEYYRYNEETKSITLFKTQGLIQGINLPPITTTYHPCRSTIIAIKNNKGIENNIKEAIKQNKELDVLID